MRLFLAFIALLSSVAVAGEIYRSVDETGAVEFSDRQTNEGAQTVELQKPSTYAPRTVPSLDAAPQAESGDESVSPPPSPYTQVAILQPKNDEAIRENSGKVDISINLTPRLKSGHMLVIMLDDKVMFDKLRTTQLALSNVDRGTHNLQVKVVDSSGAELGASEVISFHMLRFIPPKPAPLPN